jgi:hypothetical protein
VVGLSESRNMPSLKLREHISQNLFFDHHITTLPLSPRSCRGEFLILLYNDKVLGVVGDFRPLIFFMNSFTVVLSILRMLRLGVIFGSLGESASFAKFPTA